MQCSYKLASQSVTVLAPVRNGYDSSCCCLLPCCSCVTWGPDPDGINGVYLDKKIIGCAAAALAACLTRVAPHVSHDTVILWFATTYCKYSKYSKFML